MNGAGGEWPGLGRDEALLCEVRPLRLVVSLVISWRQDHAWSYRHKGSDAPQ